VEQGFPPQPIDQREGHNNRPPPPRISHARGVPGTPHETAQSDPP
jgi:hypothetical protein